MSTLDPPLLEEDKQTLLSRVYGLRRRKKKRGKKGDEDARYDFNEEDLFFFGVSRRHLDN